MASLMNHTGIITTCRALKRITRLQALHYRPKRRFAAADFLVVNISDRLNLDQQRWAE